MFGWFEDQGKKGISVRKKCTVAPWLKVFLRRNANFKLQTCIGGFRAGTRRNVNWKKSITSLRWWESWCMGKLVGNSKRGKT